MARESVKAVCEAGIKKGQSKGVIMNTLRKKFDKDDETYEKSIKYYASQLFRSGDINEDDKAKYVGKAGRSKAKSSASEKKTPSKSKAKAKPKKSTAEKPAGEKKPARKTTRKKTEKK